MVQLGGKYMFFNDGGRSVPATLASEWKRPTTTRGSSYAQFASMLHLRGFHEQAEQLSSAASQKGVVTNLDASLGSSDSEDSSGSELSEIDAADFFASNLDDALGATDGNEHAAAMLIQKQYREHQELVREQNEAASMIQARLRGRACRRNARKSRQAKEDVSASRIQARQRGKAERRARKKEAAASRAIQRRVRGNTARQKYKRELANAKKAMRFFRGRATAHVFDGWADMAAEMAASRRVTHAFLHGAIWAGVDAVLAAQDVASAEEAERVATDIVAAAAAAAAAAEAEAEAARILMLRADSAQAALACDGLLQAGRWRSGAGAARSCCSRSAC